MQEKLKKQKYYYEYLRIDFDITLTELTRFSELGWCVSCVIENNGNKYYLIERQWEFKDA